MTAYAEQYGLAPAMERAIAAHCMRSPHFLGMIGTVLEAKAFKLPEVGLVVKAAQALFQELGRGPSSPTTVFQRLHRWLQEGAVSKADIDTVRDMLVEIPLPLPTEEEVLAEIVPILKQRANDAGAKVLLDDLSNRRAPTRVIEMLTRAQSIGVVDQSLGLAFTADGIDEVAAAAHGETIGFGVQELDDLMDGGMRAGALGVVCAASGHGKSQTLVQFAVRAILLGKFAGYVSLELASTKIFARVTANLLGVPTRGVTHDERTQKESRAKLSLVLPRLGPLVIHKLPAKVTAVPDIKNLVQRWETHHQRKLDVLVVDYADKLRSHHKEDQNSYAAMGTVYEDLRLWAEESSAWVLTASQAKRGAASRKTKGKRVEAEDVSDSMEKLRVTDYLITQSLDEQTQEVTYMLGKHRDGDNQGAKTPPLPHDWACSRMVPGPLEDVVVQALKGSP